MDATTLARRLLRIAPADRPGLEVLHAVDGAARVTLTTPDRRANGLGALHAGELVTILDAAGLAAVLSGCDDEVEATGLTLIGGSATMDFRGLARGRLVGECVLDDEGRGALRRLLSGECGRARLGTLTEVTDDTGAVVASGTFRWSLRCRAPG